MITKYKNHIIVVAECIAVLIFALSFVYIRGCVGASRKKTGGECVDEGQTRQVDCSPGETGRIFQVCKSKTWVETFNDCKNSCTVTAFESNVLPLLKNKCVSCHAGFGEYATAKVKIDDFIKRTSLPPGDAQRMPKAPNAPLSADEKAVFQEWKKDGLKDACPDSAENTNPHLDFDYVETAILLDLNKLSTADQRDARYVLTTHKSDEKANQTVLKEFERGVNKAVNSMSFGRDVVLGESIDQYKTIFRYFLRDLKLDAKDWNYVENADEVNLESFTNSGVLIKQLSGTRKAWLHADSFVLAANRADVYFLIRKLPATRDELLKQLGADFDREQDDFTALFLGFADSPISLNKPRLIVRVDSNDGEFWETFDSDQNKFNDDRNVFKKPLLKSSSGKANYIFDASESIFSLPNGLHGYYLSNAAGQRQNAAPQTVVRDTASPFSSEIQAALSCYRCHHNGYIAAEDEVRAHVDLNAAQFDLNDVDQVDALYREPKGSFEEDNKRYNESLSRMGISPDDNDPISAVGDNIRRNFSAEAVAALLFLTKEGFIAGLERSAQGRQELGSLLSGGTVTAGTLFEVLPDLLKDLRIGQNPFP